MVRLNCLLADVPASGSMRMQKVSVPCVSLAVRSVPEHPSPMALDRLQIRKEDGPAEMAVAAVEMAAAEAAVTAAEIAAMAAEAVATVEETGPAAAR